MKVARSFGRLHGVMIQGCVSRTDEVPPGVTEMTSEMLTHFPTSSSIFYCENKSASTLQGSSTDLYFNLRTCKNQTHLQPHHEQQIQRTAHSPSKMAKLSDGALAGIIVGSIVGAYFLACFLLWCCICCGACSLTAWESGLGDGWHNRRRKHKKTPLPTNSGQELQPVLRTSREENIQNDAVSLSGVTVCGNERGF